MYRNSMIVLACVLAATLVWSARIDAGTILPGNGSFEEDDTSFTHADGSTGWVEGANLPTQWTFYCPNDDFDQNYGQFVDVDDNRVWPQLAGATGNQVLGMAGGGVAPQITQILGDTVKPGYSYQLQVDYATGGSGSSTVTLSAGGPVTYPVLSNPNNINSAMTLADGGGTLIASRTIGGGEPTGSFTTFFTDAVVPGSALAGQPLTISIGVDTLGTTGSGNDNWFIDNVRIVETALQLPGDANGDGKVDINDLSRVLTNYDKTGMAWADGDFNGDHKVDINDLSVVLTNYDKTTGAGPAAVPEPASSALLTGGIIGLLACGWRRRAS